MIKQQIKKLKKWRTEVDSTNYATMFVMFILFIVLPNAAPAQPTCNNYDETVEESVFSLFTSTKHIDYRQSEFPQSLHLVSQAEIRRLNFPEEQWVCDAALEAITGDGPVPERERALYKVKDYYFMVVFIYYRDVNGNQMIEDNSGGLLFDSSFNLISFVMM